MDYKREYKLHQITPIIVSKNLGKHACIRPTELKSKLDRFLNSFFQKTNCDVSNHWYLNCENNQLSYKPLNYKIRVLATQGNSFKDKRSVSRLYLGNIGARNNNQEEKEFMMFDNPIIVQVLSLTDKKNKDDKTLLDMIDEVIFTFFQFTNFGARASKGFGSFVLQDESKKISKHVEEIMYPSYYQLQFQSNHPNLISTVLLDINTMHTEMKSKGNGILLKFKDRNEKVAIKNLKKQFNKPKFDYIFSRALLGLAPVIKGVKIDYRGNNKIARFKSPITYKVNEKEICMIVEEIPNEMYGQKFKFTVNNNYAILRTPSKNEFHLKNFVDEFMNNQKDFFTKTSGVSNLLKIKYQVKYINHGGNHE